MQTFRELFNTILTTDENRSRLAAREVRKLIHSSHSDQYKDIASIIENAPREYAKIEKDFQQQNFVVAVSVLYFLHDQEDQPDFLFPWFFQLLQHENGNIRQAAVRMVGHELGPLTFHIRFPREKSSFHKFSSEQADSILFGLFTNLNNLAVNLWKPEYKRYKYIESLPTGTYKSVQLILSRMEDDCGTGKFLEYQNRQNRK